MIFILVRSIKKQSMLYAIWLIGDPILMKTDAKPGGTFN